MEFSWNENNDNFTILKPHPIEAEVYGVFIYDRFFFITDLDCLYDFHDTR